MNTNVDKQSPILVPLRITSVQPGGGFCASVELLWGRIRRGCLRKLRPGYVRAMEQKRQGECTCELKHDVIDPRDLKYYRNVCGYWFRPEDDRFAWRDRLGVARIGLVEIFLFSLILLTLMGRSIAAALLLHWAFWILAGAALILWIFVLSFFRDPERAISQDPQALVSPADGTITDIGEVEEADFPGGRAFRIGIFLSVFNVHVNRVPRSGRIIGLRYFPGHFHDARAKEAETHNEQLWIDLAEGTARFIRVKQIAGLIARRIVCWLRPGEMVEKGQRLGMIKFGSRTEIYLPIAQKVEVLVKVGDKVKGAATVLLRYMAVHTEASQE